MKKWLIVGMSCLFLAGMGTMSSAQAGDVRVSVNIGGPVYHRPYYRVPARSVVVYPAPYRVAPCTRVVVVRPGVYYTRSYAPVYRYHGHSHRR